MTGLAATDDEIDLRIIDRALRKLEQLRERQARIVEMRGLLGLTVEETAEALGASERTVHSGRMHPTPAAAST